MRGLHSPRGFMTIPLALWFYSIWELFWGTVRRNILKKWPAYHGQGEKGSYLISQLYNPPHKYLQCGLVGFIMCVSEIELRCSMGIDFNIITTAWDLKPTDVIPLLFHYHHLLKHTGHNAVRTCPCLYMSRHLPPPKMEVGEGMLSTDKIFIKYCLPSSTGHTGWMLVLPLAIVGIWNAMLMTPTKSPNGIRDRKIDLIRMASPFPAWIS